MYLHTCNGCRFSPGCDHAAYLRKSLSGFGIRSIKFACAKRETKFHPGQAVIFKTYTTEFENEAVAVEFAGYVIEQIGTRVFGFIKPDAVSLGNGYNFEPKGNGYVKIPIKRVRPDDSRTDGDVRRCDWCGNHPGIGAPCNFDPPYTPVSKCLSKTLEPSP